MVRRDAIRGAVGSSGILYLLVRVVLALGMLLPAAASGQITGQFTDGIYTGTLGKQRILLDIGSVTTNDDLQRAVASRLVENQSVENQSVGNQPIVGRYFYRRYGVAIEIQGSRLTDGSIRLREYEASKPTGAEWQLTIRGNRASGTFCRCDVRQPVVRAGQRLPISLQRVSDYFDLSLGSKDHWLNPVYYDLLPLKSGPEVRVSGEIAYVMQRDTHWKVSRPRLTRFPDAAVMARVNQALAHTLDETRIWAATCNGQPYRIAEETIRVAVFNRHLLALVGSGLEECGGVYPNSFDSSAMYDLSNGETLDLEKFLEGQIDVARLPSEAKAGVDLKGNLAFALLGWLYRKHYVFPKKGSDCEPVIDREDNGGSVVPLGKIHLDEVGLVILTDLPHAFQGCGPSVTIPYSELQRYLKKDSTLPALVTPARHHKHPAEKY